MSCQSFSNTPQQSHKYFFRKFRLALSWKRFIVIVSLTHWHVEFRWLWFCRLCLDLSLFVLCRPVLLCTSGRPLASPSESRWERVSWRKAAPWWSTRPADHVSPFMFFNDISKFTSFCGTMKHNEGLCIVNEGYISNRESVAQGKFFILAKMSKLVQLHFTWFLNNLVQSSYRHGNPVKVIFCFSVTFLDLPMQKCFGKFWKILFLLFLFWYEL